MKIVNQFLRNIVSEDLMIKLSQSQATDNGLRKILQALKKNKVVDDMFEHFDVGPDALSAMPVEFAELDVSAKTKDGVVYLNNKLLEDGDFWEDLHYIVHEACHYLQQLTGEVFDYGDLEKYEYLDKPTEVEAFKYQIMFIDDYKGKDSADQYLEDLLDHHKFKGAARTSKKRDSSSQTRNCKTGKSITRRDF